jgi:hypothetical protein
VPFTTAQLPVSTAPVKLATAVGRTHVVLHPDANILIGPDNTVSLSTGFLAPTTPAFELDLEDGEEIWAVRQSIDATVGVLTRN